MWHKVASEGDKRESFAVSLLVAVSVFVAAAVVVESVAAADAAVDVLMTEDLMTLLPREDKFPDARQLNTSRMHP